MQENGFYCSRNRCVPYRGLLAALWPKEKQTMEC
jgi:hypothetical protein